MLYDTSTTKIGQETQRKAAPNSPMPRFTSKKLDTKRNILWNAAGSMFFLGCMWLITILVVRLSDSYDAAGVLALGMAVSNIGVPIAQYKIRPYQVSDLEGEFSPGIYVGHRVCTIAISIAVMVVYGSFTCPTYTLPAVLLYCLYSLVAVFSDVLQGIEQQHDRMDIVGISYFLRGAAAIIGFIATMLFTQSLVLSFVVMTLLSIACIVFYELPAARFFEPGLKPLFNKQEIIKLFKTCLPAVAAALFASAIPSVPRQILGGVAGTAVLGGYASIAAPVLIIQMGASYVYAPLLKNIAEHFHAHDIAAFRRLMTRAGLAIIAIAIVGTIVLALVGKPLFVLLFGNGIVEYLDFLYPLILCTVVTAISWFLGDTLIAIRDLRGNLIAFTIAIVTTITSSYPLICAFGGNGASAAISFGLGLAIVFSIIRIVTKVKK